MPVITIESTKLSKQQKAELVQEMTKTAARIMNLPEAVFYVFIQESEPENIGVGGKLLSEK